MKVCYDDLQEVSSIFKLPILMALIVATLSFSSVYTCFDVSIDMYDAECTCWDLASLNNAKTQAQNTFILLCKIFNHHKLEPFGEWLGLMKKYSPIHILKKTWGKLKWPSAITWLTVLFTYGLMSALVIAGKVKEIG